MSRPLSDLKEENESNDEELLDPEPELSIDPDSERLSQALLEREGSQCERGDGTGDEDHRGKALEGDECPESTGGRKKKPRLKKPKENHLFITDFGEKISLFLPGFEAGEMTAELVSEMERDGGHLSDGGSHSLPEMFETGEGKETESLGASKRSDAQKSPESDYQPEVEEEGEEDEEVDSVCERLEQMREEVERLKAKVKKKSEREKRRQQEYQDAASEELQRELLKPRWDTTFLGRDRCRAEVDRLKAQMRQEVEQLKQQLDLDLRAEEKKLAEGREEREQLWRLYQQEVHHSVKLDYEEKLEKLREEHWTQLNNVQQKCRKEASAQRRSLLSALQVEKERMQASHAQHLETLRLQLEKQQQQLQLEHSGKMSELQRREEQLELRTRELKRTEDTTLRTQDRLDHIAKASEKLLQEREELRQEVQKASAQTQEARGLLLRAQLERDQARTDEGLLKVERDKAVQMCTAALEERERVERTYQNLEKKYAQKRGQKSPSSSRGDRRTAQEGQRKTSPRGDGDSSSLTDSSVHQGRPWKTSPAAQRGGDRTMDTEQAANEKDQRKELEETEDELQEQMEALNNLKWDRDHLKKELQDMIEEKTPETMEVALAKTEVLMKERDRIVAQRIREEKEEVEKELGRLQKKCSLLGPSRRGQDQDERLHCLFGHERTAEDDERDADTSSASPEADSAEESCCYVSHRFHSQSPSLGGHVPSGMKTATLGLAFSWMGLHHRLPAGGRGRGQPGYSGRGRLLRGTTADPPPIAAVRPTHFLHASPSVHELQFRRSAMVEEEEEEEGVRSNRVEQLVKSSRRWLQKHGKDVHAPLLTRRQVTLNKNSLFF